MKKISLLLLLSLFLNSGSFATETSKDNSIEGKTASIISSDEKLTRDEIKLLISRLNEIKHMNIQAMNAGEKSKIKNEVVAIREKIHKDSGFFIYLSTTAILIIILLLILL